MESKTTKSRVIFKSARLNVCLIESLNVIGSPAFNSQFQPQ